MQMWPPGSGEKRVFSLSRDTRFVCNCSALTVLSSRNAHSLYASWIEDHLLKSGGSCPQNISAIFSPYPLQPPSLNYTGTLESTSFLGAEAAARRCNASDPTAFSCDAGATCLPAGRLCDGTTDCSDGFDEDRGGQGWCPPLCGDAIQAGLVSALGSCGGSLEGAVAKVQGIPSEATIASGGTVLACRAYATCLSGALTVAARTLGELGACLQSNEAFASQDVPETDITVADASRFLTLCGSVEGHFAELSNPATADDLLLLDDYALECGGQFAAPGMNVSCSARSLTATPDPSSDALSNTVIVLIVVGGSALVAIGLFIGLNYRDTLQERRMEQSGLPPETSHQYSERAGDEEAPHLIVETSRV